MIQTPTIAEPVLEPDKLIRLASMAKAMLEEARTAPCDAEGCERMRRIYERTLSQVSTLLPSRLQVELAFLSVTFEKPSPSPSEIRIAQAELVGWLEGLFNGIAASAYSQELVDEKELDAALDSRPMPGQYL